MSIIIYQVGIFTLVYVSANWGRCLRKVTIIGLVLWTFTHVVSLPLMIFQLFVIYIAVGASKGKFEKLEQERDIDTIRY